jgi:hypothetical protein
VSSNTNYEQHAGAHDSTGKELIADMPQQQPTANGTSYDRRASPKDPDMREDHAEGFANEAVSGEHGASQGHNGKPTSQYDPADEEASKDLMDENGEEVEEAAEDTVIY